jgi:hypothetical protein
MNKVLEAKLFEGNDYVNDPLTAMKVMWRLLEEPWKLQNSNSNYPPYTPISGVILSKSQLFPIQTKCRKFNIQLTSFVFSFSPQTTFCFSRQFIHCILFRNQVRWHCVVRC